MPNGTPNIGSALAGDPKAQQAVQAAIQARSQGANVPLAAQTGQQPPAQTPMPTSATPAPPGVAPTALGAPKPPVPEAELLIKALSQSDGIVKKALADRLKAISPEPTPKIAPTI